MRGTTAHAASAWRARRWHNRNMRCRVVVLLALAALSGACAAPGYRGVWQPKPAEVVLTGESGAPAARLSMAVLGQWRGEPSDGELHVRFRVETVGSSPVSVPLERIELLTGDLQPCSPPRLLAGEDREVPPGDTISFDVAFSPPAEGPDLSGLQLRWVAMLDGKELPGSMSFQYAEPLYSPYGYPTIYLGASYGYWSDWCWSGGSCSPVAPVQALPPHTTSLPGR